MIGNLCHYSGAYLYVYLLISTQRFTSGVTTVGVVQAADHMISWMEKILLNKSVEFTTYNSMANNNQTSMAIPQISNLNSSLNLNSTHLDLNVIHNQAVNYFSIANGFYLTSAAIGSLLAGHYVHVYGRKVVLICNAIASVFIILLFSSCVYFIGMENYNS